MVPHSVGGRPGPLGPPPANLRTKSLAILQVSAPLYRMHRVAQAPKFFGRTGENRFDAPAGEYGVFYAGLTPHCAFIETLGEALDEHLVLSPALLEQRKLSQVFAARTLRLVQLDGAGLVRLGADARLTSADHDVSQAWSKGLHEHPDRPDGLYFRARHDPEQFSIALFERVTSLISVSVAANHIMHASNADLLGTLLDHYGIGLAP